MSSPEPAAASVTIEEEATKSVGDSGKEMEVPVACTPACVVCSPLLVVRSGGL